MTVQNTPVRNQAFEGVFSELDPTHAIVLKDRAVRELEAMQRGYSSTNRKVDIAACGFGENQQKVVSQNNPTLIIPIHGIDGAIVNYQIRPNRPRIGKSSKPLKYESPFGSRVCLDIPNDSDKRLSLASSLTPLFITEGAFKVDAGCGVGLLTIGIAGVDAWRGRNAVDGVTVLAAWEDISLKERDVFLVFDSDYRHNRHVYHALTRFKRWLESKQARVKIINLPCADDGKKMGLDDFIAGRIQKGFLDDAIRQELLNLALDELPVFEGTTSMDCPYRINNGGIEQIKESSSGVSVVPLTNFIARIIKETSLDDGTGNTRRIFTIESEFDGETKTFDVSASQFSSLRWVVQNIGLGAIVYPGRQDHAEVAIRLLSNQSADIERIQAYEHTGWRQIGGQWLYLHASGAIGATGLDDSISVHLHGELGRYDLPEPPSGEQLKKAVLASLQLREVINQNISLPLLAATYRAVLSDCDFSVHTVGESGGGKSELSSLAQQHFGAKFNRRTLPAAWSSTANAIETLAFTIKDAVFTVDDFVPRGSSAEVQRLQDKAERVFRGQGNQQGRSRLFVDGNLRPTKYPRGLVISTGEDVPRGQSLRARMLVLEVAKHYGENLMNWQALSQAQTNANKGLYAEAMAAFIQWIAANYETIRAEKAKLFLEIRELATQANQHRRLPELLANLTIGLGFFLRFAVEVEALSRLEAKSLLTDAWKAFGNAAQNQRRYLNESEATTLFRQMLGAAISGGLSHVALDDGNAPLVETDTEDLIDPRSWGWRKDDSNNWRPQGQRVGWISPDGQSLYLEPDVSLSVARKMANDTGENLAISRTELHKRLFERKLIVERDSKRETYLVRKMVESKRKGVLHTRTQDFIEGFYSEIKPDQSDHKEVNQTDKENTLEQIIQKLLNYPTTDPTQTISQDESNNTVLKPGRANGQVAASENNQSDEGNTTSHNTLSNVVGLVRKNSDSLSSEKTVSVREDKQDENHQEPKRKQVRI
jgi:hypothetical protein